MIFDVLVPVEPDEIDWYREMFNRNVDRIVIATDENGEPHHGRLINAVDDPRGVLVTLDDPRPLGRMTFGRTIARP